MPDKRLNEQILRSEEYYESLKDKVHELSLKINDIKKIAELIVNIGFDYDGYNDSDNLKKIIDELVGYANDILKII